MNTQQAQQLAVTDWTAAFAGLRGRLLAHLRRQLDDVSVAEDLLQEVFVKALAAQAGGQRPLNLSAWLYGIARNSLIDYYRAKRPTEALPETLQAEVPELDTAVQELAACLLPLARQLPAIYRSTLLAVDFEGRRLQEVADEQGVSLSAIKSRASRGRQLLKKGLLACCEVELSQQGAVLDYRRRGAGSCEDPSNCG